LSFNILLAIVEAQCVF